MNTITKDIERELNGETYHISVEVSAKLVDGSFSHDFGISIVNEVELEGVEIITVEDFEGMVVTSRKVIQQIENIIHVEDEEFEDLEFEF